MSKSVTFLTGASSGLGWALAPLLAKDGDAVALAARRAKPLEDLAAKIRASGGEAAVVDCDVSTSPASKCKGEDEPPKRQGAKKINAENAKNTEK